MQGSSAQTIEQLYREGTLYRVQTPGTLPRMPAAPLSTLPPTSPRRTVRRSVLRMMAANAAASPAVTANAQSRVARKVIIRHISHAAAPPPLGLLRPNEASPEYAHVSIATERFIRAELPPESITEEPAPSPSTPGPLVPLPPQIAPLNVAQDTDSRIEVRGQWNHGAAMAPAVVLADTLESTREATAALGPGQIDALGPAGRTAQLDSHVPVHPEPKPKFRLDSSHADGRQGPHARFGPPNDRTDSSKQPGAEAAPSADTAASPPDDEELAQSLEAQAENEGWPPHTAELGFAEPATEPLASHLVSPDQRAAAELAKDDPQEKPAAPAKPALPLWEVDRFHWPRACEKLMADEDSYLSRAGEKLLAAVQDGLRVLAITGSRRGEGRTTLALCLARAATKAGVQTAVMDADFARPQLASKIALEIAYGWQDAALGRIPLSEAAVKSLADGITVLPLESSAATRSLSLADPRVTATIRAASATFELLILDLGPLAAGERIAFPAGEACPLDAAIVVQDERFATPAQSETVGRVLQEAGVEAVGIAENFVIEEEIPARSA